MFIKIIMGNYYSFMIACFCAKIVLNGHGCKLVSVYNHCLQQSTCLTASDKFSAIRTARQCCVCTNRNFDN